MDHSDYKNNGLITKIWGGPGWTFNHAITFGYPINPTETQKKEYKNYFMSLGDVLPCKYCRDSYHKFITTGETALTNDKLKNRDTLTKWFYDVHNAVNDKLEVDYGVTYQDVIQKYESFRARCDKQIKKNTGCIVPLDYKAFSFKKLYQIDSPIIPYLTAIKFIMIAKERKLDPKFFTFLQLAKQFDGDISKLKNLKSWIERNKYCQTQIRYMRENSISCLETAGRWKGTPTIDELKLIMLMSSNLNRSEINNVLHNINKYQIK